MQQQKNSYISIIFPGHKEKFKMFWSVNISKLIKPDCKMVQPIEGTQHVDEKRFGNQNVK